MSSKRVLQIAEQIKNHIATLLVTGQVSDPRIRRTTITRVKVTPDLQQAQVYYSVYGSEEEKRAVGKGLAAAAGFFRRSVGEIMRLRYTPSISFEFDSSIENASRISELIEKARAQDRADQQSDLSETAPQNSAKLDEGDDTSNSFRTLESVHAARGRRSD